MADVVIDGQRYVPAEQAAGRIGVAITTRDRPKMLARARRAWEKYLPDGAELVVVDDASETPVEGATYRFERQAGIAVAKNKCMELLTDRGCEHLFLFDDDTWPAAPEWWRPYVDSPEPHAMYLWESARVYADERVVAHTRPKGAMLYVARRALDVVGGMDPAFGVWGFEHESWSDRMHAAGLTTARYQDVRHEPGIIYACDEHEQVASSVPEKVRRASNPQLAIAGRESARYIPLRAHEAGREAGPLLSVLVPSVHTRRADHGARIADELFGQYERLPIDDQARVEILMHTDTKAIPLGDKRNQMVRDATGEYVAFVDDDDRVEPDYLTALLGALAERPDVVTFTVSVSVDGGKAHSARYSIGYERDEDTAREYRRLPNHLCAVRREHVLRTPFAPVRYGEDGDYAARLRPLLRTEHVIDRVLYHYDYRTQGSETQLVARYRHEIEQAGRAPVADVVVLSHGSDERLRAMTQHTVDTARATAGEPINVVVVEQTPGVRYRGAITMRETGPFAYNAFANKAARTGSAKWIVFANNDLEFCDGWLSALLAARHGVVSPANPTDRRQSTVRRNEMGTTNGKHFSGWCFMMRRDLWDKIGGLDEDFRFWCADDSVIEQVSRAGVRPMLVPGAKVKHLTSRTIGSALPDELTWDMVVLFEQKYGVKKFENDRRYAEYKRRRKVAA